MARAPIAQTLREKILAEDPTDTPTKKIVREKNKADTKLIVDEVGREIHYKSLGPLEQMRLYGAIGDQLANNEPYMRYAMIAMAVQTIDGDTGPPAVTRLNIEARVSWIGEEGFTAIWTELIKSAREVTDDKTPEEIAEDYSATLKKDGGSDSLDNVSD